MWTCRSRRSHLYLPHSQKYPAYARLPRPGFTAYFEDHTGAVAAGKGDPAFFNPALFHGAGNKRDPNVRRMANLLQVSSAFGRARWRTVDTTAICVAVPPVACVRWRQGGFPDPARDRETSVDRGPPRATRSRPNHDRDQPIRQKKSLATRRARPGSRTQAHDEDLGHRPAGRSPRRPRRRRTPVPGRTVTAPGRRPVRGPGGAGQWLARRASGRPSPAQRTRNGATVVADGAAGCDVGEAAGRRTSSARRRGSCRRTSPATDRRPFGPCPRGGGGDGPTGSGGVDCLVNAAGLTTRGKPGRHDAPSGGLRTRTSRSSTLRRPVLSDAGGGPRTCCVAGAPATVVNGDSP
jgi:hypothetical protein